MRAIILAAGAGQRMGEITQKTPKPLLQVNGRYLISYAIEALRKAGIHEMVINVSYLKEQIMETLGNGAQFGVDIVYSEETERLETGGGIVKALPMLGPGPFIAMSSDLITNFPMERLTRVPLKLAHLVLVNNPPYHPHGDFCLRDNNEVYSEKTNTYTFASIGVYHPDLFAGQAPRFLRLAHLWQDALSQGKITGECHHGLWYNVGTPQELKTAEEAWHN